MNWIFMLEKIIWKVILIYWILFGYVLLVKIVLKRIITEYDFHYSILLKYSAISLKCIWHNTHKWVFFFYSHTNEILFNIKVTNVSIRLRNCYSQAKLEPKLNLFYLKNTKHVFVSLRTWFWLLLTCLYLS